MERAVLPYSHDYSHRGAGVFYLHVRVYAAGLAVAREGHRVRKGEADRARLAYRHHLAVVVFRHGLRHKGVQVRQRGGGFHQRDFKFAVVQRDNEYYLTHNFFGEDTPEGTAFLDEGNSIYPLDEHILIHGHNMRDGSVFGDLDHFRDLEFLQENSIITFNTLYENGLYVPFAVFDMSATPGDQNYVDMRVFNFESDEDFLNFAFEAKDRSIFDIPVDVERGDHILSLVTCSYDDDNGRLIVMSRSLRDGETAEEMAALVMQAVEK